MSGDDPERMFIAAQKSNSRGAWDDSRECAPGGSSGTAMFQRDLEFDDF